MWLLTQTRLRAQAECTRGTRSDRCDPECTSPRTHPTWTPNRRGGGTCTCTLREGVDARVRIGPRRDRRHDAKQSSDTVGKPRRCPASQAPTRAQNGEARDDLVRQAAGHDARLARLERLVSFFCLPRKLVRSRSRSSGRSVRSAVRTRVVPSRASARGQLGNATAAVASGCAMTARACARAPPRRPPRARGS